MTELKRESGEAVVTIDARATARANTNEDHTEGENPVGIAAVAYDAQDYRLMGTFPASDAVAQY